MHPIPSGTRDVLPEEAAELRRLADALRDVFLAHGYGEVRTPALEYEAVMAKGDLDRLGPAYRLFDEHGATLVLRPDMTTPIARVVTTRFRESAPPLRFWYLASCYRAVPPQRGQPRELIQAGVELVGAPAPGGTAEVLTVLCAALTAVGLSNYRVAVGDAAFYPRLMEELDVASPLANTLLGALARRDLVGLAQAVERADLPNRTAILLRDAPQRRGGPGLLPTLDPVVRAAAAGLEGIAELVDGAVRDHLIFDLGLVRNIGYYTGAIFEVYDPALGFPLGGGGRYDELLGRFGRSLPAAGFALDLERLHIALAGQERGERRLR